MIKPNPRLLQQAHAGPYRQRGASIVLMAVALFMILGFAALAVDGSNLYVARNELHNAADAGALAGARMLYTDDGSSVNVGANAIAQATAESNTSQGSAVEVFSVKRGHWSFATRTFFPNEADLEPIDLFSSTTAELDLNERFINAVEVVAERDASPVQAFFGRIFGFNDYKVSARAVAYIGFASSLRPEDADQPIGICKEALLTPTGEYACNVGRFIPDGDDTGGWTNFQQNTGGAASANEVKSLVDDGNGNPEELIYGEEMQTNNGQLQPAFDALYKDWFNETAEERPWNMTLPVLDCSAGVGPSNKLVGAVNLNVIWMNNSNKKVGDIDANAPYKMALPPDDSSGNSPGVWENSSPDGITRWDDFVEKLGLENVDGSYAKYDDSNPPTNPWRMKTIYFLPDCSYHEPKGNTGGENYGVLARIPVLVD